MTNEMKILSIHNRIALLSARTDRENTNIIHKLKRQLKKVEEK